MAEEQIKPAAPPKQSAVRAMKMIEVLAAAINADIEAEAIAPSEMFLALSGFLAHAMSVVCREPDVVRRTAMFKELTDAAMLDIVGYTAYQQSKKPKSRIIMP